MARGITTHARHSVASASRHAAIYTRISKDREGKALGVERQTEDCIELAKRLGYTSWEVFTDNDISASTLSNKLRPAYETFVQALREGRFDGVIAYSNSRLTRRVVELQALIDAVRASGVRIHTVASGQHDLDTADGRASMLTIAVWDQAEAERTAERVKSAQAQRVGDGGWHGGVPPFGFRKEAKTLHVEEREAALINEAASRVLNQDETLYSIVKDWNSRGDLTRKGTAWKHSVLRNVLVNPALIGTNSAGVEDCWTAILDAQTHARLVDRLAPDSSRRTNPLGVKSSKHALGGGLVRCGRCEKPLYPVAREGLPTKLTCRAFANGDHPNHPKDEKTGTSEGRVGVDAKALEDYLFSRCVAHLNDSEFWRKVRERREEATSDIAGLRADRDARQGERDRAGRAFIAGIMSEREAQTEVARLDAEIQRLTDRIERGSGGPVAADVWASRADTLARWDEWEPGERRLFFRDLIEQVTVGDWPAGIPTTTLPRKDESPEDFQCRRWMAATRAMVKRVDIAWRA